MARQMWTEAKWSEENKENNEYSKEILFNDQLYRVKSLSAKQRWKILSTTKEDTVGVLKQIKASYLKLYIFNDTLIIFMICVFYHDMSKMHTNIYVYMCTYKHIYYMKVLT